MVQYKFSIVNYCINASRASIIVLKLAGSTASTPTSVYSNSSSTTRSATTSHHQQGSIVNGRSKNSPSPSSVATTASNYDHDSPPITSHHHRNETTATSNNRISPTTGNSIRCSNCGAPGSRFECLGCEVATYCNEACQAQHWTVHVSQCPKIMPRLKKVG